MGLGLIGSALFPARGGGTRGRDRDIQAGNRRPRCVGLSLSQLTASAGNGRKLRAIFASYQSAIDACAKGHVPGRLALVTFGLVCRKRRLCASHRTERAETSLQPACSARLSRPRNRGTQPPGRSGDEEASQEGSPGRGARSGSGRLTSRGVESRHEDCRKRVDVARSEQRVALQESRDVESGNSPVGTINHSDPKYSAVFPGFSGHSTTPCAGIGG